MKLPSLREFALHFQPNNIFRILLLSAISLFTFVALILPISARPSSFQLNLGDVVISDIQAPYTLNFVSDSLSEKIKQEAENSISQIYLPADPAITRHQLERLRLNFSYITSVRSDLYSSTEQKISDLSALTDFNISSEVSRQILALDNIRWQTIQQETLRVLEQVMRSTIREDRLREAQRSVPTFVSFSLPQDQANIVIELATSFIAPNSVYSEELTQIARKEARDGIKPALRTFVAGELIAEKGHIITELDWEALQQFGLIISPNNSPQKMISAFLQVAILTTFIILYFNWRKIAISTNLRSMFVISFLFLIFLYAARYLLPNTTVVPYLFPLPAFGLTLACLLSPEIGLVLSLPLGILVAYGLPNNLELTMYYILTGLCGILSLGKGQRIANFFWAGTAIGLTGSVVILTYRLVNPATDFIGMTTLIGSALVNGMASASMALLLQFLFANLLGITTALRLLDLSRPNHPLLQYVLLHAPGTYQHSLQVANLAEQAAEAIGADALLVRVGALYHDTGKAVNPSFFIENQIPGTINPHDFLGPEVSASIIIQHISDGISLSKKHRLPPRIQDFILEHHGSLLTRYQYTKALEKAIGSSEKINIHSFSYPGPPPRSKETAILMLADGCEAKARAELPKDKNEIRAIVNKMVDFLLHEGQFINTMLTFQDLYRITESFIITLQNSHHPRLRYPEIILEPEDGQNAFSPSIFTDQINSILEKKND